MQKTTTSVPVVGITETGICGASGGIVPPPPPGGTGGNGGGNGETITWNSKVLWFPTNQVVEYSLAPALTTRVRDAALLGNGTTVSYNSGCYTPDWSPIYNPVDDMMYFTALKYLGATDIANSTNPHHMLIKYNPRTLAIVSEVELPGGKNKLTDNTTLQIVDVADNRIWLASAVPLEPTIPRRISTFTRTRYHSGDVAAVMVSPTDVLYGCIDWQAGGYAPYTYHYDTIKLDGTVVSNTTITIPDYNGHYGTPYQCLQIPQVLGFINQTGGPPLDFGEWYYNGVLGPNYPLGDGIGLDGVDAQIFNGRLVAIGANIYSMGLTSDLGYYIGKWIINAKHPSITRSPPSGWGPPNMTLNPSDDGYLYIHNSSSYNSLMKLDADLNTVYDYGTSGPAIGGYLITIWNNIICYPWSHIGGDQWCRADRMNPDHTFTMLGECPCTPFGDYISLGNGYVSVPDGIVALFAPDTTQTIRVYNTADLTQVFSIVEPAYTDEWTYGQAGASGKFVKRNGENTALIDVVTITSPTTYTKVTLSPDVSGGNPVFNTRGGERRCWSSTSNKMFVRNVGSAGFSGIIGTIINMADNSLAYVHSPAAKDFGDLRSPFWDPQTNTYQLRATDTVGWSGSLEISLTGTILAQHGGSALLAIDSYTLGWESLGNFVFMYTPLNNVGAFRENNSITTIVPAAVFTTDTFTTASGLTWPMNNYAIAVGSNPTTPAH